MDDSGLGCSTDRRDDAGSSTVEVAVALPVMMLMLLLIVQAALYFHTRAVATTAAHKGLDAARVEDGSAAAGRVAADSFLDRNAGGLEGRQVIVTRSTETAEVTVSGHVTSALFGADLFPVEVTARGPVEAVAP